MGQRKEKKKEKILGKQGFSSVGNTTLMCKLWSQASLC